MFHTSVRQCELMNLHTVYTDHSLMNLDDVSGILINKVLQCYSCNLDAFICVSHANCVNFLQRQHYQTKPNNVYIIPNAVDSKPFLKDYSSHSLVHNVINQFRQPFDNSITVIVLARLVYRKGVFLLEQVIDRILSEYPNVNFLIGGSGDQEVIIQSQAIRWNERCNRTRILMLGEISHENVPAFFVRFVSFSEN